MNETDSQPISDIANLPVIDISCLFSSTNGEESDTITELIKACKRYGMFKVKGHQVSQLSKVIEASVALFKLDQEVKESIRFDSLYESDGETTNESDKDASILNKKSLSDVQKKEKEGFTRGYIPIFGESGRNDFKELKEAFSYGYTWSECCDINNDDDNDDGKIVSSKVTDKMILKDNGKYSNPLQGENIWPEIHEIDPIDLDRNNENRFQTSTTTLAKEHKEVLINFFNEMARAAYVISHTLLYATFKKMNKRKNFGIMNDDKDVVSENNRKEDSDIEVDKRVHELLKEGDTISLMRAFHYFSASKVDQITSEEKDKRTIIGSSSHTDWGLLTLILQDSIGGLQVYDEELNKYLNVPGDEGHGYLICNAGDYMSLLSASEYVSPIHRVLPPPMNMERYSMVFFYYPNYDTSFEVQMKGAKDEVEEEEKKNQVKGDKNSKKRELSAQLGFNTLLDLNSNGTTIKDPNEDSNILSFGQYIQKKWKGVNTMG